MGRHSRKGRAKAGHPPEGAVPSGDPPPSYGTAESDAAASRPQASYGPPDPRDSAARERDGSSSRARAGYAHGYGHGSAVRGGHPEHREPGGGWGADASGRGPEGGNGAVGRVLQGTPGAAAGAGKSGGPRQEYVEAFDDSVFGKGGAGAASAVRAPAPRHPDTASRSVPGTDMGAGTGTGTEEEQVPAGFPLPDPGPAPVRGPGAGVRRPATPGPWNGYESSAGFARSGPLEAEAEPRPRQDERAMDDELTHAAPPPPRVPAQVVRTAKGGSGKGRALTGLLAAAVLTVIAFAVAGQITNGSTLDDDGSEDDVGAQRGLSTADGPAAKSDKGKGAPDDAQGAALSYTQKLGKTFALDSGFKGAGTFKAVPGGDGGAGGGQVMRYRVDVEKGLPLESGLFAQAVQKTLNDKRSWAHGGERSFKRVSKGDVDFVITLASSPTTDVWCQKSGLDTSQDKVSCDSASTDRVMINAYRWAQGSKTFGDDRMLTYRQMLINHEVGHRLGRGHVGCPKDGALAPVMMQQTKSLTTDGAKCRPNPWPYPRG